MKDEIQIATEATYRADIFIGGNRQAATEACREFCLRGLCVSVSDADFVFTCGMESGVRIGLINYPRFPVAPSALLQTARELGEFLIRKLHQSSCSIVADDITLWLSRRD